MKRITIKDVAEVAGVSPSAVSRVFTQGASASEDTRTKVMAAADKLGYRPSRLARGLTGNRTNLITVVYGSIRDPFDALVIETLSTELSKREIQLMLVNAGNNDTSGQEALSHALDYSSDGIIVTAGTVTEDQAAVCARAGVPVLMIGRELKAPGSDSVLINNYLGGQLAADFFLRSSRKSPGFLAKATPTYSNTQRMKGFIDSFAKENIDVEIETPNSEDESDVFNAATRLLNGANQLDCIFCSNDYLALRLIEAAHMSGISIPQDLAVIGFNDLPHCALPFYRLTSLRYCVDEIVKQTLDLLERRLNNPAVASETIMLTPELVIRESSLKKQK